MFVYAHVFVKAKDRCKVKKKGRVLKKFAEYS